MDLRVTALDLDRQQEEPTNTTGFGQDGSNAGFRQESLLTILGLGGGSAY